MKSPLVVIVGIAAGLVLVAAAGASAHTALQFVSSGVTAGNILSDDASAPRAETPEASESPEVEPSQTPEPSETPETEANDDQGDNNDDQGEDKSGAAPTGQHSESDSDKSGSGSGGGDD